ncbi:MAG TPA: M1 family metallopeptidase [Gemmatimonadales bacterium]|nr:M1 family metallopeptidase [Gemmatimonadales bacterium]
MAPRRRSTLTGLVLLTALSACSGGRSAPVTSPTPGVEGTHIRNPEVPVLEGFERAVTNGTRSRSGTPGPRYWQQWADYRLEAELNPVSKRLTGKGSVTYYNRSPDTLKEVYVQLLHNIFAPNSRHNTDVPWAVEGIELGRVAVQGQELKRAEADAPGYQVDGTVMRIQLPQALPPGGSVVFDFTWKLRIPPDGAPRGGQDGEVFYINYWYPQMAVYDDINGWQIDQYLGNAEFYMGYGNYDVALTVPAGWLVDATGRLQNPAEVLSPQTRARLDSAGRAPGIIHVVTDLDRDPGKATTAGTNGKLTWRFRAEKVRDVSWATSARYLWDATNAVVGDATGDGRPDTTAIYSFYRPEQRRISHWDESARYSRHSIEFFSKYLAPYPYPHMSAVDGPTSCGGMEYPMMTCIGGQWDTLGLYEVTAHEIGHMWFPMIVGSDEKRYAWMDEGLTQFDQSQAMDDFFKGFDDEARNRKNYLDIAEMGSEVELMHHGDRFPTYASYGAATYYKPASVLVALRGVLGAETFHKAYAEYIRRWSYKHPSPYDFFHTFEDVSGKDLSWFWRSWFFETWKLDQAIDTVTPAGDSLEIVIENRGRAQMPVLLAVTRAGGRVDRLTIPAGVWFTGGRRHAIRIAREPMVKSIEIDTEKDFPDLDRSNQVWPR